VRVGGYRTSKQSEDRGGGEEGRRGGEEEGRRGGGEERRRGGGEEGRRRGDRDREMDTHGSTRSPLAKSQRMGGWRAEEMRLSKNIL
jgi:hypothetical protein